MKPESWADAFGKSPQLPAPQYIPPKPLFGYETSFPNCALKLKPESCADVFGRSPQLPVPQDKPPNPLLGYDAGVP